MEKALYRKYRSRSLSEVVGQEHITQTLDGALKAGRVHHAYLFTGPHGVGKTSIARILAHEINQLPYDENEKLDIIEIDAASNRRIDDIRDLRDKVHIAPVSAKYKVYIIDEVHMLTGESFNALLKTLEEPPKHVVFILATTEAHKLPDTIISRTQRFNFRSISTQEATKHLRKIAEKEGIQIDNSALELIARQGQGSFRDSIGLLDQIATIKSGQSITVDDITRVVGLVGEDEISELVEAVSKGDHKQIASLLTKFDQNGINIQKFCRQLTHSLAKQAESNPEYYRLIDKLIDVPKSYDPATKLLTTLILFSKEHGKKSVPMMATKPKEKEFVLAKVKPKVQESAKNQVSPVEDANLDWTSVLDLLRVNNPPLYGVVKQGQPKGDRQEVVLLFQYQLHAKKLEDASNKAELAKTIEQVAGAQPKITVMIDKNARPPKTKEEALIESVTDIMGGGELING